MKFDAVVTNPPYQDSSHKEKKHTLWRKFVDACVNEWVKADGHVALIIPSSWMGSAKLMKEYFINNNLTYINKDECRRHFDVGSTFSCFVMQKCDYKNKTEIINKQINGAIVKSTIDLDKCLFMDMFPRDISEICYSIVSKVLNPNLPKLGIKNVTTHHNVHKERWKKEKEGEFKYPVQNTPTKLYWFNTPHPDQGKKKILIPTTTYFRRMMITEYGTTQSFGYYLIPDHINAEVALNNINNIVFDYVNECFRYANWNDIQLFRALPELPLDRELSNEDIYEYFSLGEKEIKHIKDSITWRQ
jgi:hypothetical protein